MNDKTIGIILASGSGSRITDKICRTQESCGQDGKESQGKTYVQSDESETLLPCELSTDSPVKKQYIELLGRPILTYTLDAFEESQVDEVYLVVTPGDEEYVRKDIVEKYGYTKVKRLVPGGSERYLSAYQGLLAADRDCRGRMTEAGPSKEGAPGTGEIYVLIHDAARALITGSLVNRCIDQVRKDKACVIGVPAKDTIRMVDEDCWSKTTPPRKNMWIVHTPQCFVLPEILEAFERMMEEGEGIPITDDGMVMEAYGSRKVRMFKGSYENIKITTPDDLVTGEAILKKRANSIPRDDSGNKESDV